jgi:hypothetical protein
VLLVSQSALTQRSSLFGIGFDCSIAILVSVLITILYRYLLVTALRCPQAV